MTVYVFVCLAFNSRERKIFIIESRDHDNNGYCSLPVIKTIDSKDTGAR